MSKIQKLCIACLIIILGFSLSIGVIAQDNTANPPPQDNKYYKALVKRVVSEDTNTPNDYKSSLEVELTEGPDKGNIEKATFEKLGNITSDQKIKAGDRIVIIQTVSADGYDNYVVDRYRLDSIYLIVFIAIIVTIFISGKKGITSIVGLVLSILILIKYLIPSLQTGQNPIVVGLLASTAIALTSMYLAHGFNRRTSVSLISTFITILIALIVAVWAVDLSHLFGLGSEEAYYLQSSNIDKLDMRGLLLAGIIIGTLGILDDITISQVSIVEELHDLNNSITFWDLVKRGLKVGKEHIASLINTLALAYVGVSLPLLLTVSLTQSQPVWVLANSEFVAEEIVRTLVGSITLIIAVPISTFLGAYFIKYPPKLWKKIPIATDSRQHNHSH